MPTTTLEAVRSSSLNTARKIWNALPAELTTIAHPKLFKTAMSHGNLYKLLADKGMTRRVEERILRDIYY